MKQSFYKQGERGISLIEVLLAIGIFTLFVASLGTIGLNGVLMTSDGIERYRAVLFAEEGVAALRSMRAQSFSSLVPGTYGIATSTGAWVLTAGPNVEGKFTRTVTISSVGTGRVRATVRVAWTLRNGLAGNVQAATFLHQLYGSRWIQTTRSDFEAGNENGVRVIDSGDGAVELENSGDWAAPSEFLSHNVLGPGTLTALVESGGVLYLASSAASTKPLLALDISNISTGVAPEIRSTDSGATVNAMLVHGEHLYLATDGDSSELIVLRKGDLSLVRVVNLTGNADALSIVATGTALYLGRANSTSFELYQFDITNPASGIPTQQNVNVSSRVNTLALTGAYIILGTAVSTMEIIVMRTSDFGIANTVNLSGNASVLASTIVGDRLYVGRTQSGAPEIAEINIANILSVLTVTSGVELGGSALALTLGADGRLYAGLPLALSEVVAYQIPGLTAPNAYNVMSGTGASSLAVVGPYVYVGLQNSDPELVVLRGGTGQWSNPQLASLLDLPSNADGVSVAVSGSYAYHGTESSSGAEFSVINVTNPNVPLRVGSIEIGATINDIAIVGPYAYLATSDNSREIVIVNVASSTAPVLAGSYNTSGNSDGITISASGTQLFLGTRDSTSPSGREAHLFSIAIATTPTPLSTFEVGDDIKDAVFTPGGYLVLATDNNAKELLVLSAQTTGVLSEVTAYNTSGGANALAIASLQSTILLGTENNGSVSDVYFFTQNPTTGTVTFVSGINLNTDNESVALSTGLAFLGNDIGGQGLTVLNTTNIASPQILGSLSIGTRVNAVALDSVYAYLGTSGNDREFAIASPNPLISTFAGGGWFTSSSFTSGAGGTSWGQLDWTTSGVGSTTLQVRTSGTALGLQSATWVGVGGVANGVFESSGAAITPYPLADGTMWIQYRVRLSGSGAASPQLENVAITYN